MTQYDQLTCPRLGKHVLYTHSADIKCNGRIFGTMGFSTHDFKVGDSIRIMMTLEKEVHFFKNDVWRGSVRVEDYPLDIPMWGVVDVYGRCNQVKAEIYTGKLFTVLVQCMCSHMCSSPTVSRYNPDSERRLREMGLVQDARPQVAGTQSFFAKMLERIGSNNSQDNVSTLRSENGQLQQQLTRANEQLTQSRSDIQQFQLLVEEKGQEITQLRQQLLTNPNNQRQRSDIENQQLIGTLIGQVDVLQRRVASLSVTNRSSHPQEVEFWQVSPEEVSIREDEILGRGAWGYVAKGNFRGTTVAVKRVYPEILRLTTMDRIRREIRTMAQIRHPNLVLFVAAVLNEQTGPMIVTELLDTSLRSAYQDNRVGPNKRRIFGDISSALVYLHRQREPIIHRDVSSANVLLLSLPNNKWLAKLSDFGSANVAQDATSPAEGAILYTAPEAYPHPPTSSQPPPQQTTKIDVYSFGVLACEVVTRTFPKSEVFLRLLLSMEGVWRELHPLITSCVSHSPQDRPSMDTVLHHIKQLDSEP